jgi:hypothetical protein
MAVGHAAAGVPWSGANRVRRCSRTQATPSRRSVGDAAQGTTVGMAARPEGVVAAAALGVVQHGHPGPVEHGVAQPDLGGVAHGDDARLAAALGHRRHAGQGPERGVVAARERASRLGEQGGERDLADPGQRTQDGHVARPAALRGGGLLAQGGAERSELALGLVELAVGQAQPAGR